MLCWNLNIQMNVGKNLLALVSNCFGCQQHMSHYIIDVWHKQNSFKASDWSVAINTLLSLDDWINKHIPFSFIHYIRTNLITSYPIFYLSQLPRPLNVILLGTFTIIAQQLQTPEPLKCL